MAHEASTFPKGNTFFNLELSAAQLQCATEEEFRLYQGTVKDFCRDALRSECEQLSQKGLCARVNLARKLEEQGVPLQSVFGIDPRDQIPRFFAYLETFGAVGIHPDNKVFLDEYKKGWWREILLNGSFIGRIDYFPQPPRLAFTRRLPETGNKVETLVYAWNPSLGKKQGIRRDTYAIPFP